MCHVPHVLLLNHINLWFHYYFTVSEIIMVAWLPYHCTVPLTVKELFQVSIIKRRLVSMCVMCNALQIYWIYLVKHHSVYYHYMLLLFILITYGYLYLYPSVMISNHCILRPLLVTDFCWLIQSCFLAVTYLFLNSLLWSHEGSNCAITALQCNKIKPTIILY